MRFKMGSDGVERRLQSLFIGDAGPFAAKAGEESAPLRGVREKPMHIAAAHSAIGGHRAIAAPIGEMQQRPRAIRPKTAANMHFITGERSAVVRALFPCTGHQQFVAREIRLDVEQAEPWHLAGRTFDASEIANDFAEHLIAAAKAEHMAAAPQMREKIDIPALAPETCKIGYRGFRARQNDNRRLGWQSFATSAPSRDGPRFPNRKGSRSSKLAMPGRTGTAIVILPVPAWLADGKPLRILLRQTGRLAQKGISPRPGQPVNSSILRMPSANKAGSPRNLFTKKPLDQLRHRPDRSPSWSRRSER